ncbi:unnamed protein product [Ranitomeya imitator]|uniref:39S ribosomal protein L18, mitochondrial n=1 Tax=Ranitomeya imitator TaxID=111125 RepID=A0ABN9MP15_9NEOB|nr:unnamed protein product [Ranitomeya imitator]
MKSPEAISPASTSSRVQTSEVGEVDTNENEIVNPDFSNRNPRNLERLALAVKDRGWGTVWPTRQYWHRFAMRPGPSVTSRSHDRDVTEGPGCTASLEPDRRLQRRGDRDVRGVRLERTAHHVTASVEHCSGNVVVSASTREWAVKKHLYSTKDAMACENIGRILSQRCLEAGIHFTFFREIPWVFRSESVRRKVDLLSIISLE